MAAVMSVNDYSYNSIIFGSKKVYVPVKPLNVIYTQFDHVSGVEAKKGQQGVSVSKARILNTLINHLVSQKEQKGLEQKPDVFGDSKKLDVLIAQYQDKLQATIQTAEAVGYGLAGASPDVGVLFSIDA